MVSPLGPLSIDRVISAVERVRQRLLRAATALHEAGVPYAIVGGNAVALWVSRVDESAVRSTQDVDLLIRRSDFEKARAALERLGFASRRIAGIDAFLDRPTARVRDAVQVVFAGEPVRPGEPATNPDVSESEDGGAFRVISLDGLVRIKLTAFRDQDRTHLRGLIGVGLLDRGWLPRLSPPLRERLERLLDDPDG